MTALPPTPSAPAAVHALRVLWPAFLLAGVAEMLVFALIDPLDLGACGGEPAAIGRPAVYTLAFLLFWALISTASALTLLLGRAAPADAGARR